MASQQQISGIDLTDDEYTIQQALIRNKYKVYDADGTLVLRSKQKLFKMKERFPFVDADGEPVFEVAAEGILDVAGDYTITDEETGEPIAVLDKNWTLFSHKWKVRDPHDERLLARIESSGVMELIRNVVPFAGLIPHTYDMWDADGNTIGEIEGQLSIKDRYDLTIEDTGEAPKEAIVASAIVIDALEGN